MDSELPLSFLSAGSGWRGRGLRRCGALLAGFGVYSVGFVLRAAPEVVIHLQYRMSKLVRAHHVMIMSKLRENLLFILSLQLRLYLPKATMNPCKETAKGKQKHLLYQVGLFVYKLS